MKVNYKVCRVDDLHRDLICGSCDHSVRGTRDQLMQWLTGGYDPQVNPFRLSCPSCGDPYEDLTPVPERGPLDSEFVRYGKTVADVLSFRGQATDEALSFNIEFILLDKEERKGIASFSTHERNVYAVQALVQEVNNGGFKQFFHNSSGRFAFDLIPALDAMGLAINRSIVERAVHIFGNPRSLSSAARWKSISKITRAGTLNPWSALDDEFYDNPEYIEKHLIDYIANNLSQFAL